VRVFAAFPLPPGAVSAVTAAFAPLRRRCPGLKWVRPEQMHITLQFFGEMADSGVEELIRLWADPGMRSAPIPAILGPPGQFPPEGNPRVLWVGVDRGRTDLEAYAARFCSLTAGLGFAPDPRGFSAHITVARNPGERVDRLWRQEARTQGIGLTFTQCLLYKSILSPAGALYDTLGTVSFTEVAP
jgi:RNA 2',3'-cyclic 3'-phosphodiesterase